jgi:hypothetical protein
MPPRKKPAAGSAQADRPKRELGEAFIRNLKKASPGMSDGAVLIRTLRSMAPDRLRALLAQGTPREHNLLFNAIPGDQIAPFIASLPTTALAPETPPPAPPAPTGGPPASILQTTYENVPFEPAESDPNWAEKISDGSTIGVLGPPPWEWVSVYDTGAEKEGSLNNPMVGLTGWAVSPDSSDKDLWFVHPFGFDFEFYVAPDPQYEGLLAASNSGIDPSTGEDSGNALSRATGVAHELGLPATKGVLGVESDTGLVPQTFQQLMLDATTASDGTPRAVRVATFGRWIVDCGHPDFHTEIHAPLLMAAATTAPPPRGAPGASEMTSLQVVSRPFTVSQQFGGRNIVDHLLIEVLKVEATNWGIPLSTRVEAHPTVFTTPYEGRPYVKLLVQPPPRKHINPILPPQRLMVSFHFTHRAGVATRVFDAGNGTVGVIIVLGDLNPAPLPAKSDWVISWEELGTKYAALIDLIGVENIAALDPVAAYFLARNILTDLYDPPVASSPLDNQNVATPQPVDGLAPWAGLSEDDAQPFPIYGWLNAWWQDEPMEGDPSGTSADAA